MWFVSLSSSCCPSPSLFASLSNQFCHAELIGERRADINHIRGMWPRRNILLKLIHVVQGHIHHFQSQTQSCQDLIDDYSENQTWKLKSDDHPQSACCLCRHCFLNTMIDSFFLSFQNIRSECQVVERYLPTSAHMHDSGHMFFLHHNKAARMPSICQEWMGGRLSGVERCL